jgi:segregation and condensation protein B
MNPIARQVAALLFCSPDPVSRADLCEAIGCAEARLDDAVEELRERFGPGGAGIVLREVGGGLTFASDPEADDAVRRLLSKPRTPPLSQAQAECLAIVAYLQPVSRPEIARIRGVISDSPVTTLEERGLIEEKGRTQFGAILYRTSALFEKLFGLESLKGLPEIRSFEPSAEDAQQLRDKLLKAGEQRVG